MMDYNINLGAWNSVFAVPSIVVDKHIKMAGSAQLKVLLFLLRHAGDDVVCQNNISKAIGLSNADISDALQYWLESGVLKQSGDLLLLPINDIAQTPASNTAANTVSSAPDSKKKKEESSKSPPPKIPHVTHSEAAAIMKQNAKISFMLNEAQLRLERMINPNEQAILISLCTNAGLPVDVVLMVMEFAVLQGKTSINKIEEIGLEWANSGIKTHVKAQEKLDEIHKAAQAWSKLEKAFGTEPKKPTDREKNYAKKFVIDWKFSTAMLKKAYELCIENTGNTEKLALAYISKILENWYEQGIKNISDLEKQASLIKKAPSKSKHTKQKKETSYDINDIESMIFNQYVTSEKKVGT